MKIAHLSDLHFAGPLWSKTDLIAESRRVYREGEQLVQSLTAPAQRKNFTASVTAISSVVKGEVESINMRRMLALKSRLFWNPLFPKIMRWCLQDLQDAKVDCVIITGDLTSAARPSEFRVVRDFLRDCKRNHTVIIVPGNHDLVYPLVFNQHVRHVERLHYFLAYLREFLPETLDASDPYPLFYLLEDEFCCIALDSTYGDRLSLHAGSLLPRQVAMATQFLEQGRHEGRRVIFALHHAIIPGPARVRTRSERVNSFFKQAEEKLITLIPENAELLELATRYQGSIILHGHKHHEFVLNENGLMIHCAGTSLRPDLLQRQEPSYTILTHSDNHWSSERRVFPASVFPLLRK